MGDRAFMYCPHCRANGARVELIRESHLFNCPMGHSIPQEQLMAMNPEMIKIQPVFKAGPNDVKAEFWCNSEILNRAKEHLGVGFSKTIESILRSAMQGDYILIDGAQASELKKLGIRNGAEMLATAKQNQQLVAENEGLVEQVNRWEKRIAEAMTGA